MQISQHFWAVTSYYNPFGGNLRLLNYHNFRNNLSIPLITVEWSPKGKFDLKENDADILVQISGGDILWQKERLLNIALNHLPASCQFTAWLDCDVLFDDPNWHIAAEKLLGKVDVIQLFEEVINLKYSHVDALDVSIARQLPYDNSVFSGLHAYANKFSLDDLVFKSNPGLAYAARTKWLKNTGLYDAAIVGGGDSIFFYSILNKPEVILSWGFTQEQKNHFKAWFNCIKYQPSLSFLPLKIYHMFHGDSRHRRYSDRHMILTEANFDPIKHLELTDRDIWKWTKEANELQKKVFKYIESRLDR
jgi:hypothetical protein